VAQRIVEMLIGRLITDEEFRTEFLPGTVGPRLMIENFEYQRAGMPR
jgi:hypothetical protein